jgi:hypothetical protein
MTTRRLAAVVGASADLLAAGNGAGSNKQCDNGRWNMPYVANFLPSHAMRVSVGAVKGQWGTE